MRRNRCVTRYNLNNPNSSKTPSCIFDQGYLYLSHSDPLPVKIYLMDHCSGTHVQNHKWLRKQPRHVVDCGKLCCLYRSGVIRRGCVCDSEHTHHVERLCGGFPGMGLCLVGD